MEYEVSYSKGIEQVNKAVLDCILPRVVEGETPTEGLRRLLGRLGELYTYRIEGESVTVTGAGDSVRHVFAINPAYSALRQMTDICYKGHGFSVSVLDPPGEAFMDDAYAVSAAEVLYVELSGGEGTPAALCQCADMEEYESILDRCLCEVFGSAEGRYRVTYSRGIELKALEVGKALPEYVSGDTRKAAWRETLGVLEWMKTYDLTGQWFSLDSGLSEETYLFKRSELYEALFGQCGSEDREEDAPSQGLRPAPHIGELTLNDGRVTVLSMFWPEELLLEGLRTTAIKAKDGGDSMGV